MNQKVHKSQDYTKFLISNGKTVNVEALFTSYRLCVTAKTMATN